MKTKIIFLFTILFFSISVKAQANYNDFSFKAGEKLEYNLYYNWGFIWLNAAKVDFTVKETTYNKTPAYQLLMTGETIKTFSVFYFKDTTYAYVNKNTLFPYFAYQASRESNYFSIDRYIFPEESTTPWQVFFERETKRKISMDTITADKPYFDLLSTLYRLRNLDLNAITIDYKIPMPMVFNDGTHDLYVRYVGKDQIKLKNGETYNCLKFKPLLAEGKMFEKGEGMTIWISDDKNYVPLMIESKLKIGSIKAMISSIKDTAYPMTSEVKKVKAK